MGRDALLVARPFSQGAVPTAGEAVSDTVNSLAIAPGIYDVEIQLGIPTGTPTGVTATIQEQGYLAGALTQTTVSNSFAALVDPRARTISTLTVTNRLFMRGVKVSKWNNGAKNVGVSLSIAGGTTPSIPKAQVTFWPDGRAPMYTSGAP